jgi:DNA-binding transcriptional LysR family regulator
MPSLLSAITQRFRNLTVEIVEDSHEAIENALNDGRVDIALLLVSNYTEDSGLKYETILRFARKLWTRPDHALQDIQQVKLEDIAHENYLLLDMDGHVQIVNKYWHECGLTPNVWMKSKSIEAIRSLVSLGQGVTILSDLVYRPWSLEGNRISRRDLSSPVPTMDVGVVWRRSGTMSMPCRELVELLRSWKKTMPGPKSVNLP